MAASLAAITEIEETLARIGLFVVTVTAGLAIHQLVVLPLLYFVIVRNNPFRFFFSNIPAWVTAFASTSGAMAIPDVIKACEEKHKIDSRLTRFAVPFVTTLNADGSALYIVSASMFLSQLEGFTLDAGQIVMLVTLTTVACMALPSVPSSSIVTIVILLTSLNLPVQEIALLFTVEWLLDRLRTTSNVMSHAMSVPIIYRFCKEDLKNHPEQTQERKVRFDLDDYSEGYGSDDKRLNEEEMVEFATHNL
ncbi:excitatory amino acid transporter 2-like [Lingula anatina]|uniref:Amino acid transporter n=1 Tax=Lingula anatina TaxID=7574 RepID=A0A1S3IXR8_LINAN|nr:excitatory amino acid transporter 2-like [Lingula anatina]|eukprot:XP_013402997.1 excitatory amino acid transporter 2-like [Lingula anatina]